MFCSSSPGTMDSDHQPSSRPASPFRMPLEPVHLRLHVLPIQRRRRSLLVPPKDVASLLPMMNSMESSAMKKILTAANITSDQDPHERKCRRLSVHAWPDQENVATRIPHHNSGAPFTAGLLAAVKATAPPPPPPAVLQPMVPALTFPVLVRPPSPALPGPPTHGFPFGRPRAHVNPYPALAAAAAAAAAGSRLAPPRPIDMTPREPIPAPTRGARSALIPVGQTGGAPSRRPAPRMAAPDANLPDDAALANMLPRNPSYVSV